MSQSGMAASLATALAGSYLPLFLLLKSDHCGHALQLVKATKTELACSLI